MNALLPIPGPGDLRLCLYTSTSARVLLQPGFLPLNHHGANRGTEEQKSIPAGRHARTWPVGQTGDALRRRRKASAKALLRVQPTRRCCHLHFTAGCDQFCPSTRPLRRRATRRRASRLVELTCVPSVANKMIPHAGEFKRTEPPEDICFVQVVFVDNQVDRVLLGVDVKGTLWRFNYETDTWWPFSAAKAVFFECLRASESSCKE
jgi:hypothetical protein